MDLMRKAKERMGQFAAAKPKKKAKESLDSASVRSIQSMLNKKGANLDIDGKLGPLTKKSIKKFLPQVKTGLAPEPNKTTAVQGKKIKEMRFIEFINKPKRNYVSESLIQELFPALAVGAGLGALGKHFYDKYKGGEKPSGKTPSGGSSRPEPRGGSNSSYWTYSVPDTTGNDYDYDPDSQERDQHGNLAFQYDPNPNSHNSKENVAKAVAAGRRMPPNVYPPDAKPHPINPEIAYYKNGRWWDYPSGEPWSDTSPALQSRDYYTTRYGDQYGQKRGAYRNVKINPVAVNTSLPKGDGNPEFEKIQDNFGNHVLPVGKYDFKGNSICVWYKPGGGRNQMYTDLSRLAIAGSDSLKQGWQENGYQMQGEADIEKIENDLGPGIVHTSILKKNGVMGDTFVAAHYISKIAFKYQGKPAMSYVQVTHFGSAKVWKAGGSQAFYNVIKGLSLGQGLEPLEVVDSNIQHRQFPRESKNNKAKQMRLYELEQPSGTLYIIFKLNPRTEQVNVIGDFATFPEEVVQRSQNVGIRDKKGGKGRPLRVNFQFQDASSALGELEDAIRDVDFIGGEAAELVFPLSAMRSEFGEELHELKSLIASGADERFKLYKGKDAGSEPDTKPKGVDHFVVGPDGKRRRVPIPGKPNSQMGGQAVAQPNVFRYKLLATELMPKLRDMGYKFDNGMIVLRADQRDKLKGMLGDKFGQVFGSKDMFKQ